MLKVVGALRGMVGPPSQFGAPGLCTRPWTEQVFVDRVDADADGERIATAQNGVVAGRTGDVLVSAQALGEVQIAAKLSERIVDRRQAPAQTGVPGQSTRANEGLQLGIERIDRSAVSSRRQSCVLAAHPGEEAVCDFEVDPPPARQAGIAREMRTEKQSGSRRMGMERRGKREREVS